MRSPEAKRAETACGVEGEFGEFVVEPVGDPARPQRVGDLAAGEHGLDLGVAGPIGDRGDCRRQIRFDLSPIGARVQEFGANAMGGVLGRMRREPASLIGTQRHHGCAFAVVFAVIAEVGDHRVPEFQAALLEIE